jgi:hypothetical protein
VARAERSPFIAMSMITIMTLMSPLTPTTIRRITMNPTQATGQSHDAA